MDIVELLSERTRDNAVKKLSDLEQELLVQPIVIFGCGYLGSKVGKLLLSKGCSIIACTDNNEKKWGAEINGITIISPADAAKLHGDAIFIVTIWSPGHSFATTTKQLADLGIKRVVHVAAVLQLFPNELLPHFHFQTPDYFFKHRAQIAEVYNAFADDESKRQYLAHIDCRINLNFEGLPESDPKNQYFPHGVVLLNDQEVFFDAGAYDGDTLQEFLERVEYKFDRYIALEPDPGNRVKLQRKVESLNTDRVDIYPFAVGKENCTLTFNATGGPGAGISANGNGEIEVECVRIDDKFFEERISYMKFDIEGAELGALLGAEKTIEKSKPKIAVCLYHLPDDPWSIPLYLKAKFPFYKFFVRTHHLDGFEFVLYAIPD